VRLIEEDDLLFDVLVPERHSFANPVTFGKIRTTFLYSERVYNMDTYNGSLYNSTNPCDMDKDFSDSCSGGQSSKFNIYLEMEGISNDKIKEIRETIIDYSPFHAILHGMKMSIKINDLILPPSEKLNNKVHIKEGPKNSEKVESGEAIYCKIKYTDGNILEGRMV
jgi:hypothetical protein